MKLILLLLGLFVVQVWCICPNRWMPFDDSCYRVFENKVSWPQAQFECETHDGYLAVIGTRHENDNVHDVMRDLHISMDMDLWIELADMRHEGIYEWEETKHIGAFFDWANHEPTQSKDRDEDCVRLYGKAGHKWADTNCSTPFAYLCERHRVTAVV